MRKKVISLLLLLAMCVLPCVPVYANEVDTSIALSGFSYNMDGSQIDSKI